MPAGWCASSLAEIGIISPRNATSDDTLASFVRMSSIPVGLMEAHATEQQRWGEIKSGFTHFAEGDVGLAKITPCFENGKSTIFRNLENGIGAGTTELHIVRPLGSVLPEYILVFLKSPAFLKNGEARMTGSAGQKRLPRAYFESTPFPLPPLAEQHRIAARVEELMTLCGELEARGRLANEQHVRLTTTLFDALTTSNSAQTLADNWQRIATHFDLLLDRPQAIDALEQTILQLAVRGLLVPQDASDESAKRLLVCLREVTEGTRSKAAQGTNNLLADATGFTLPVGWAWASLSELGRFASGKTPSKGKAEYWSGTIPWVSPKDMKSPRLIDSENHVSEKAINDGLAIVPESSVLIVVRSGILRRTVPVAITAMPCTVNQDLKALTLKDPTMAAYVQLLIAGFESFILSNLTKIGTTVESMKFDEFSGCRFPLPPLAEQHRIVAHVAHLRRLCDHLRERLNKVRTTQTHLAEALVTEAVQPQRGVRLG